MTKRVSLLTVLTLDSWIHISVFYFIAAGSYRYFKNHWFLRKKDTNPDLLPTTYWND